MKKIIARLIINYKSRSFFNVILFQRVEYILTLYIQV